MREGSLDAPIRHPLAWREPEFLDPEAIDAELRRVFDVCHGCRRCINLCDSFPRLFDLIDDSTTGELDSVDSADFGPVVDACTLCDMCFLTKCPYVPPHEFNLDFPHLMLRYRALQHSSGSGSATARQLTRTDRNGRAAGFVAPVANWASKRGNRLTRPVLEAVLDVHHDAALPRFHFSDFLTRSQAEVPVVDSEAPGHGRKAVLYATCFANYNNPAIGQAARQVLARNGVETAVVYPSCCGMPQLEHGDIADVADRARRIAVELRAWIGDGYEIIAPVPSCALMLKFEWPLIVPEDENVKALSSATRDIDEYMVGLARSVGLAEGMKPVEGKVLLHMACHSRAQNFGQKSAEMLRLIPEIDLTVIERCSGHGGSWGIMKDNFETALKVGKPVARQARRAQPAWVVSGCPLAGDHIVQGMQAIDEDGPTVRSASHPVELLARAYGY